MNTEPKFEPFGFDKGKLIRVMKEQGIDGILLSSPENVYYTTRYTGLPSNGNPILYSLKNIYPYFVYINTEGKVTLICWGYSTFGVQFGANEIKGFGSYQEALKVLETFLKKASGPNATLGIESTCPYFATQIIQTRVQPGKLIVIDSILAKLRLIKSAREVELVRKSVEIIEKTLTELYDEIRVGMSRLDLMQNAKYRLFKNGATGISHLTFSFGKANPEVAIGEILEKNALVTLDLGGNYLGYISDNRRYAFTGEVPQALKEHYNLMVEVVDSVGKKLVPGTSYADVFRHAIDLYDQHHIQGAGYINHVGHNIGLQTEEEWLTNDPDLKVETGMVINIELYSPAPTGHHIGDEETFLIEEQGPRRISMLPTEIRSIL
jgi:Xaa-Pro aminopeptidase